jgi:uncharacterized protein
MDYFFLSLALFCLIMGVVGSLLPVLPGPPISWLGLLFLFLTNAIPANYWVLFFTLLISIVLVVLDYVIPAKGTKKYGGSTYGIWGTNIGLVIGLFSPIPLGFIIGPFLGAFIGEVYNSKDSKKALKAASGSFVGFLASTFIKFIVCTAFLGYYLIMVWNYKAALF